MPAREWEYDPSTSRLLSALVHVPVGLFGGAMVLLGGFVLAGLLATPEVPETRTLLLVGLLVLVGGPFSLVYLLPMLTDSDQRPSVAEFSGAEGYPHSVRSTGLAVLVGAAGILLAVVAGIPGGVLYWGGIGVLFGCVLAAAAVTTEGELVDGELTVDGTTVPLAQVVGVRTVRLGGVVVVWLSYARRSGAFLPRVFVVPDEHADAVLEVLASGRDQPATVEPPDRAVQAVLLVSGLLAGTVAGLAYLSIGDAGVARAFAGGLGVVGLVLCLLGVRGV